MKKKLFTNSTTALIYQIIVIICGFVLPRYILLFYGSEVNGVISSITQFIYVITYLDFGVGAVVQSNLYKPLVQKDENMLSKVFVSSNKYFQKIAYVLIMYIVILLFVYPNIIDNDFSTFFIVTLIMILSIDRFAQYYFGITNQLLLMADQKAYIIYGIRGIAMIVNTALSVILMKLGCSIQIVKLSTVLIYLVRPIVTYYYVYNHYSINKKIKYNTEPIKQKWNGFAQHIAAVILDGTDVMVLTLFADLGQVSIYSVYALVMTGIKGFILSFTNSGITPMLGRIVAQNNKKKLTDAFSWIMWGLNTIFTVIYGAALILIVPFVMVYTSGIIDVDYYVPTFAYLLVCANWIYSLRMPFNIMILASGHFKQTQKSYLCASVINIVTSVIMVHNLGLVGVAIGTLVALSYQTIWQAFYVTKNLVEYSIVQVFKQYVVNGLNIGVVTYICGYINLTSLSISSWIVNASIVCVIYVGSSLVLNFIFYRRFLGIVYTKVVGLKKCYRLK